MGRGTEEEQEGGTNRGKRKGRTILLRSGRLLRWSG